MKKLGIILIALMLAGGGVQARTAEAETDWVAESNANADVLLKVLSKYAPEQAGQLGVDGFDEDVFDLKPKLTERANADTAKAVAELEKRLASTEHPLVRQDLEILIQAGKDGMEGAELNEKYLIPYFNISNTVFNGLRALLDPQIPAERRQAALVRLRKYAGLEEGYEPIVELAKGRSSERFGITGVMGPYTGQLETDLNSASRFIDGIAELFQRFEMEGWEEPYAILKGQLESYNEWLATEMMEQAREDHRLPYELYAFGLKQWGTDLDPRLLIDRAQVAYLEIRNEMDAMAPLVAAERGWDLSDYRDVIRALKEEQFVGEEILARYQDTLVKIEEMIRDNHIVSLPARDASIRLASEAESANIPAPHLRPPRLIGNTGEYAEFVLPLNIPAPEGREDMKLDDFTHQAMAWTLTAHEARPGHELQFSTMLETGVSTARAVFAFNSVNVEGWALYAEAEMKPYFPLDGQLIGLQSRMLRAARAFLDPMVNLGEMTPDEVQAFLEKEVMLSKAAATSERERYTFRIPGQATAYFYGYSKLMELRAKTEIALGDKFNRQAFHDFILAQGLLPPELLAKAVLESFVPQQMGG